MSYSNVENDQIINDGRILVPMLYIIFWNKNIIIITTDFGVKMLAMGIEKTSGVKLGAGKAA